MTLRLAPCLLLAACGTIRGYEGERAPPEERATIVSHAPANVRVRVVDVDGVDIDRKWSQGGTLELRPGLRAITLRLAGRLPHELVDLPFFEVANCATVDILVDVEAGRRYVFVASVQAEDEAAYEITDAETERVVASWDLRR